MRVLVAMSGGVDSSVAAALLAAAGHDVVGATLKLWGGESDSGCCSVGDVEDARRVAQQLGIAHHVFNDTETFERHVVEPYVLGHAEGRTPNPCVECNRHVKFGTLLARAERLGFEALATGHHARVERTPGGALLCRGADDAKDQSYVLSMLGPEQLERLLLPIGELTKDQVRAEAVRLGLRTATKPDSQDVCFINSTEGRAGFLGARVPMHAGVLVDDSTDEVVGSVAAVELVTLGQRRGLGLALDGRRRFAVDVDVPGRRVRVADAAAARSRFLRLASWTSTGGTLRPGTPVIAQTSAHGAPADAVLLRDGLEFASPARLVAPGQTVAFYDRRRPDVVLGSALVVGRASAGVSLVAAGVATGTGVAGSS